MLEPFALARALFIFIGHILYQRSLKSQPAITLRNSAGLIHDTIENQKTVFDLF